jgi:hypothetical protein
MITNYYSLSTIRQLSLCFFVPQCLCGYKSIMQNKPNFRNGKMNVSIVLTRNYACPPKPRRRRKQTQSNPTCGERTCLERSRKSRTTCPELVERNKANLKVEKLLNIYLTFPCILQQNMHNLCYVIRANNKKKT